MTILKIIKEDPEKEILINSNNNVRSSDKKISEMVDKFRDTISETIVDSMTILIIIIIMISIIILKK